MKTLAETICTVLPPAFLLTENGQFYLQPIQQKTTQKTQISLLKVKKSQKTGSADLEDDIKIWTALNDSEVGRKAE